MSKKIKIIIEREVRPLGGVPAPSLPGVPAPPTPGAPGVPVPQRRFKVKIQSARKNLTGWDKFLQKLKRIPGPGKRLYAILSAGALAKAAKDAYINGYMHEGYLRKGANGLMTYIFEEGIIDLVPGIGEAKWLLSLFDDETEGTYMPDRYERGSGWIEKK